jgi:hypothetical protein
MRKRWAKFTVGAVFGLWTVVGLAPRTHKSEAVKWLCRCKCGVERAVVANNLQKGETKSCGETCPFEVPDGRKRKKHRDLTGEIIGNWTVLKQLPEKVHDRYQYLCRCACGTERTVRAAWLMNGHSRSCGCLRLEAITKSPFESVYNKLLYVAERRKHTVDLSYEDYLVFTHVKECHYCGANLYWRKVYAYGKPGGHNLDRKDNSLGYSVDNCVVCCGWCNRTKGDRFTYEEFMLVAPILRMIQELRKAKT